MVKVEITKSKFGVTILKYGACPFCESKDIYHDSKLKVYLCSHCGRAWK